MTNALSDAVLAQLRAVADPARAPAMQAYMKSAMPYLGVAATPLQRVCKGLFADLQWPDTAAWQADVLTLWRNAVYREQRYAAIALTGVPAAKRFQTVDALPMYEEMVVTGAWWDHVDAIAGARLWSLLDQDRARMSAAMRVWSDDDNLWKRRCAILCQLHAKRETDLDLLYRCIAPSLESKEFFLRKAIGWALRQYARTDPDEVLRYVRANEARLSGLSRREALKHLSAAR